MNDSVNSMLARVARGDYFSKEKRGGRRVNRARAGSSLRIFTIERCRVYDDVPRTNERFALLKTL